MQVLFPYMCRSDTVLPNQMNFGEYLDYLIQQLKEENRLGYAESFKGLKSSLIRYCDSLDFLFTHIDQQWLKGYEMFLIRSGKKENTIGIRFRSLRVIKRRDRKKQD